MGGPLLYSKTAGLHVSHIRKVPRRRHRDSCLTPSRAPWAYGLNCAPAAFIRSSPNRPDAWIVTVFGAEVPNEAMILK